MKQSSRIKICGLRDTATIEALDGLPVDEIGFVFAPSKRQIDPADASKCIAAVHRIKGANGERPQTVGVFVNISMENLKAVLAEAPLDIVQFHGDESSQYCQAVREQCNVKVWKAISIRNDSTVDRTTSAREQLVPYQGTIDAVLLDAPGGGTGKTFNWEAIDQYKQAAAQLGMKLYTAGGLNEGNVQELLRAYSPDGVDVSSGVETNGRKDIEKIRLFVRKVIEA